MQKTCAGCKYFFAQASNPSECHRFPPHTTSMLIGLDAQKRPVIHKDVTYDLVLPTMTCGEWKPRVELN